MLHSQHGRAVDAAHIAARLNISDVAAAVALDALAMSELVEVMPGVTGPTYRLAPLVPELTRLFDELMSAYWNGRVELLAEIAGSSIKRVRFHAHQLLQEALRMERTNS